MTSDEALAEAREVVSDFHADPRYGSVTISGMGLTSDEFVARHHDFQIKRSEVLAEHIAAALMRATGDRDCLACLGLGCADGTGCAVGEDDCETCRGTGKVAR